MRLWDTIYEATEVLGSLEKIGIIRADAIYRIGLDILEEYATPPVKPFRLLRKIS